MKIADNGLICKLCTNQVDVFDQFYAEIHKNQENLEQQQTIDQTYIILLKENKTEIQLKEVEDVNQELSYETIEQIEISQHTQEVEEKQPDELVIDGQKELSGVNMQGFPKQFIKDGKLIIKGKELSKLIAKFYRLECSMCSSVKTFKKFSAMINHFKKEHAPSKGFVACCGMKISKIRQIALHMARHIQPEAFQCPRCKKLLTCPKILQYHIQNHLPEHERNLACSVPGCNRRFSYQSALATHSISHLPESERTSFCCEVCGRKFSTSGRLTAHISMIHTKSQARKEFTCGVCSKIFLCKSNLSYHLTTHKNFEFQVQCSVCKKWLKNKICLKKHMIIHSEVRQHCDICEYSAANKQCLINHKKVQHCDKKPFNCLVCMKTFKLKNTLTNHVNAHHNGLRNYSCEFCVKTFVSSGNCKRSVLIRVAS